MFGLAAKFQNAWFVLAFFVVVVIGQALRLMNLPKDVLSHLTDTGRRKR